MRLLLLALFVGIICFGIGVILKPIFFPVQENLQKGYKKLEKTVAKKTRWWK